MPVVRNASAYEILDSRGRPTIAVKIELDGGVVAEASVPSGASTGTAEMLELRDGDIKRYGGKGCRNAVNNVSTMIAREINGTRFDHQSELDAKLLTIDGTSNKSRCGANAILGVSLAFARAHSIERGVPLYKHFADMIGHRITHLPQLTINLFSGGKHAGGQVPIQDVLGVPVGAKTIDESLSMMYALYQSAAELGMRKYCARPLVGDEGGLAPPFQSAEEMLDDSVAAIIAAGLRPSVDMSLAVDVASSHFHSNGRYQLGDDSLDSGGMIERIHAWVQKYPLVSVEDGLAEDDWKNWPLLKARISSGALVLGDDFLCTNPDRISRAIESDAANALLLKVNQIGTLTEAAAALKLAREAGWHVTVSARSGETEDHWLADLATGWGGDQIKIGSITRSERLAKYNRLLAIENELKLPLKALPIRG